LPSEPLPSCEFNSQEMLLRLDVLVAAEISAIGPVVERVMEIARDMKCAEGKDFEIETALREALANAIVHGAKHDASKHVQLCVGCDEARGMLIVVRDPGPGFDPQSVPNPVVGQNVFSEHGRGIFLINQLMDEVRFERGGTEIHMKKS
jgi:serine/threonine-protein kinase RsbW